MVVIATCLFIGAIYEVSLTESSKFPQEIGKLFPVFGPARFIPSQNQKSVNFRVIPVSPKGIKT